MKTEILKMLHTAPGYSSGEQISQKLDVSRASIWKHIKALREDGCVIEAHTNKGYRLITVPDLLKPEYINLYLDEPVEVVWFRETDSTNTQGKKLAREKQQDFFVVTAEHQSSGKGRLGRAWSSSAGQAIQMSFVIRPDLPPRAAPVMNLAVALGICNAIERQCGIEVGIKWPNDVVYEGKKLCGILTEMSADMDRIEYLVSGAGTNVNQQEFDGEIKDRATSLRLIAGEKINRVELCAAQIDEVKKMVDAYVTGGMQALMPAYCAKSVVLGKELVVINGEETQTGICTGFGTNGELQLEINGEKRLFLAGEVSVRGKQSYV